MPPKPRVGRLHYCAYPAHTCRLGCPSHPTEKWRSNGSRVGVMVREEPQIRLVLGGRRSWAELRGPGWRTRNIFRRTAATFTIPSPPSSAASCRLRHLGQDLAFIRCPDFVQRRFIIYDRREVLHLIPNAFFLTSLLQKVWRVSDVLLDNTINCGIA